MYQDEYVFSVINIQTNSSFTADIQYFGQPEAI